MTLIKPMKLNIGDYVRVVHRHGIFSIGTHTWITELYGQVSDINHHYGTLSIKLNQKECFTVGSGRFYKLTPEEYAVAIAKQFIQECD